MTTLRRVSTAVLQPNASNILNLIDLRDVELPFRRPEEADDFDPKTLRNPSVTLEPWLAYFNLVRSAAGAGMLGVPLAISQAGLIVGPLVCFGIGLLFVHTHLMLLWCLNDICRQLQIPYLSYRYGFRLALLHGPPFLHKIGHWGPFIIALFMILSQLGVCSVSIIFIADNLRDLMDWESSSEALLYMFVPFFVLELLMKNLKIVSEIAMTANFLNAVSLILVMYTICTGPRRQDFTMAPNDVTSFIMASGIMMFNISVVGIIISSERALKDPTLMQGFKGIINVGIMIPTLVSIIVGTFGAFAFGKMEENILRFFAYDDVITTVCFVLYTISMTMSYPLACFPAIQMLAEVIHHHDPRVKIQDRGLVIIEFVSRPVFLAFSFTVAYFFPFQGPFVAFVGCLCSPLMSIVFPALMDIGLRYPGTYGRFEYILIKDALLVVAGLIVWVSGINLCGKLLSVRVQFSKSPSFGHKFITYDVAEEHASVQKNIFFMLME